ncbi:hypothetical protein PGB90_006638 [Kerria lacca]
MAYYFQENAKKKKKKKKKRILIGQILICHVQFSYNLVNLRITETPRRVTKN